MENAKLKKLAKKTDAARARVTALQAELAAAEADLKDASKAFNEALSEADTCPVCGNENGKYANFCNSCGCELSTGLSYNQRIAKNRK